MPFDVIGIFYAITTFFIWGLVPLYWKQFEGFDAFELLIHRVVWSFVLLSTYLFLKGDISRLLRMLKDKRFLRYSLFGTFLIFTNWWCFIWAVSNGHIIEASIGYFINPIVNVLLGVFILKESLRRVQWLCVGLSAFGVSILSLQGIGSPWISVYLAMSFGLYGVVKKKAPMPGLWSLLFDTALCTPILLILFYYLYSKGAIAFFDASFNQKMLALGTSILTIVPLFGFLLSVGRLNLSTVGLIQYITPIIQLFIGVQLYGEEFTKYHLYACGFIWLALFLFALDGLKSAHKALSKRKS